jgi:3'-phosphoadenosine 5'-phosphosulfate sulfotransferase (PAPS reductase)/FAD synthetase
MKAVDFSPLQRHEPGRVALMFSGGKDSRALIEMFRPYLDGIIVYHLDTGDLWPETREYVAAVAADHPGPRGVRLRSPGTASIMSTSRKRLARQTVECMRMIAIRRGSGERSSARERSER